MGDATFSNNVGSSEKLQRNEEPENQLNEFNASKQASGNDAASQVGILQEKSEESRVIKKTASTDAKNCETILGSKLQIVQEEAKEAFFDKVTVEEIAHMSEQGLRGKLRSMQEEVEKALAANNEAYTKQDCLKTLTSGSDALSVSAEINTQLKSQKAASKDLERELQKNIQSLQEEVDASVSAKLNTLFELERENVLSRSHESDEVMIKTRQELQESEKSTMAAKLVADAKLETLGKKLAAKQAQKAARDRREQYLIEKLQLLREEVEEYAYAKHVAEIELDKMKITAKQAGNTGSDELLADQLKESKDKVESLQMMKATADAKVEDLQQQVAFMEAEVEAATKAKLVAESLTSGSENGEFVNELKDQLQTLQKRKASADTDVASLKKGEESLLSELNALRLYANRALTTERKRRNEFMEEVEDREIAMDDALAKEKLMNEKLKSLQGEVDMAVYAKNLAESEIFKVPSSSSSSLLDDLLSGLKKELYDSKVQNKSREDAATARETVLQAQLQSIEEEAEERVKIIGDTALATENELIAEVKSLQDEVKDAIYAKYVAEEEAAKARSSSGSNDGADTQETMLEKEVRDLKEEKAAQEKEKVKHDTRMEQTLMSLKEEVDSALHAMHFAEEQLRINRCQLAAVVPMRLIFKESWLI